jgi:hypothetical protein
MTRNDRSTGNRQTERVLHVEILRFPRAWLPFAMVRVPDDDGLPVDTPTDLEKLSSILAGAT